MRGSFKKWIGLLIACLFLLLALCFSILNTSGHYTEWIGQTLKEIACLAAVFAGLIWVSRREAYDHLGLMQKLRLMSGLIFILWGLIKFISGAYPLEVFYEARIFGKQMIWLAVEVSLLVFLTFQIFSVLRALIFIQPGRWTARNFNLLLYMVGLVTITAFFPAESETWEFERSFLLDGSIYQVIARAMLLFMAFLIGFRCKWMHYLNRSQKLLSTAVGIALLILLFSLMPDVPGVAIHYSVILAQFIKSTIILLGLYGSMAILGLILHLPSAGLMDRRMQDIRSLQQISATIGTVYNRPDLLVKAMNMALQILHADFTWIELKKKNTFQLESCSGMKRTDIQQLDSYFQLIRETIDKDEVLMINDIYRSRFFRKAPRWPFWGGSLLVSILKFKHEIIGIMVVGKENSFGFIEESRGVFRAFCDQVAVALENVRLVEMSIEREVYKEELRVAHEAQMRLLPQSVPRIQNLEVDGFCLTANDIGGDFYDYIEVGNRLDIVIGDVSGKGAAAAFYMAELKGVIQALAPHFNSPKQILIQINTFLRHHMESNMFVTMFYLMLEPRSGKLTYARAGHEPLGFFHNQRFSWVESGGLGLGLADTQFTDVVQESRLTLRNGDGLFLYTDGLIEVRNHRDEEFGQQRLSEILEQNAHESAQKINEVIRQTITTFCGEVTRQDDMTAVMIKYRK
jgi:sigma-B regulation protein RsbU (phosphoserine phosphatase)